MFVIIGIAVVFGAILARLPDGAWPDISVLLQPAELANYRRRRRRHVADRQSRCTFLRKLSEASPAAFGSSRFNKQKYLDTLKMMYELFGRARRDGLMALESDSDDPQKSAIFSKYPAFLKDHHALDFVCDTLRMASSGGVEPFDADQMMEADMEAHHHDLSHPISALSTTADALPGLGIVAAVLGVVITMGALGGPPEEIGKKVAAALVGTFLGILLCYGFVGPLAANMMKSSEDENAYYHVLRVVIIAFMKGAAPSIAVEIGRRAIPGHVRPSFEESENYCRGRTATPEADAAPSEQAAPEEVATPQ